MLSSVALTSCSLDTKLSEEVDFTKNPITTVAQLEAGINGVYAQMKSEKYYGNNVIAFSEVRSEGAYSNNKSNRLGNVSGFTLTPTAAYAVDLWFQAYKVISEANRIIEAEYPNGRKRKHDKRSGLCIESTSSFRFSKKLWRAICEQSRFISFRGTLYC